MVKRRLLSLVLAAVLLLAASPAALAADFTEPLAVLGLMQGTERGLAPERTLTRGEGVVLLLRLLGLEQEAETSALKSPFSDGGWADPYLAFALKKGLVNGCSPTCFGTQKPLTCTQYSALLLRALGLRDGRDFVYEDAAAVLSARLGTAPGRETLTRGGAAQLSWLALASKAPEGGRLADRQIESGAFTALDYEEAARLLQEKKKPETTTVLFYIIASDLERLQGRATEDFDELLTLPASDHVRLVLQTGGTAQWRSGVLTGGAVERSVISGGRHTVVGRADGKMTDPGTLAGFLRWGTAEYPADRYVLVL